MAQRITNGMMINDYNRNLNGNLKRMSTYQNQLATNRKFARLSENPVDAVKTVNAKAKLADIGQYQRNLRDANAWLTQTETALTEMNEIIKRAEELAVYASNEVLEEDDKRAIREEIVQLRDQILTLSNTTIGDRYIFGGYNTTYEPFQADSETGEVFYNGEEIVNGDDDGEYMKFEITFGIEFDIAISGSRFMGIGEENNVYHQFFLFANALEDPASGNAELQPFIASMQNLQNNTLSMLSDVGGRINRIELMENRFAQDEINYTQMRSDAEDLDTAEAIMNFSMAEAVYRSALGVGGRVLTPTLMDFMR